MPVALAKADPKRLPTAMAELGKLERAKRQRLQGAYEDLRPANARGPVAPPGGEDDRRAKLRHLLHGAAADAASSLPPQQQQAMAAAAAAALHAVAADATPSRGPSRAPLPARQRLLGTSPGGAPSNPPPATDLATFAQGLLGHGTAGAGPSHQPASWGQCAGPGASAWGAGGGGHSGSCSGGQQRDGRGPPPPPDPMAGGFLPEADPIARLDRMTSGATATATAARTGVAANGFGARAATGGLGHRAGAGTGAAPRPGAASAGVGSGGGGAAAYGGVLPPHGGAAAGGAAAATGPGQRGQGVQGAVAGGAWRQPAAGRHQQQDDEEEDVDAADVPSDVELALISIRSELQSHDPFCRQHPPPPPLAMRSQLATLLADRGSVERQLDDLRRANRVRTFKLPTGVDEFGVLTTSEYRQLVRQAADTAAAAAAAAAATAAAAAATAAAAQAPASKVATAAAAKGPTRAQSAPANAGRPPAAGGGMGGTGGAMPHSGQRDWAAGALAAAPSAPAGYVGAYGSAEEWQQGGAHGPGMGGAGGGRRGGVGGPGAQSRWHVAAEAFLARVVDRCTEFQLTHSHLRGLLQQGVQGGSEAGAGSSDQGQAGGRGRSSATGGGGGGGGSGGRGSGRGGGEVARTAAAVAVAEELGVGRAAGRAAGAGGEVAAGGGAVSAQAAEEQVSLLLHLGCLTRHTDGDADAYVLAVPGAGPVIKALVAGRRELTTWLSKRQYKEAPEDTICKLKLRSCFLPPRYLVRDMLGRGLLRRMEPPSGTVYRLAGKQ